MAVVEGVGDVEAVEGGGHGEEVRVGGVVVGAVEEVGVAGEAGFGDEGEDALQLGGVAVGAAEVGWVEAVGERVEGGVGDAGLVELHKGAEVCVALDVGWGEEGAFVGVVAEHDREVLGEVA